MDIHYSSDSLPAEDCEVMCEVEGEEWMASGSICARALTPDHCIEDICNNASAGDMSPYSDGDTPPAMQWARSLDYVLNDGNGCQLFKQYLDGEDCGNALEFHFAIKGMNKLNSEEQRTLVVSIYRHYVRKGTSCLPSHCLRDETRALIRSHVQSRNYNPNIFSNALMEVYDFLRTKHAAFVESPIYIQYINETGSPQHYDDAQGGSRSSSASSTSGDIEHVITSNFLTTVQEESSEENDTSRNITKSPLSAPPASMQTSGAGVFAVPYPPAQAPPLPPKPKRVTSPHPPLDLSNIDNDSSTTSGCSSLPPSISGAKVKRPASSCPTSSSQPSLETSALSVKNIERTVEQRLNTQPNRSTLPKPGRKTMPPNPYHTNYVPKLPPSMRDSELQSVSSGAETAPTTDTSLFESDVRVSESRSKHRDLQIKNVHLQRNKDKDTAFNIPRTQRPQGPRLHPGSDRESQQVFHWALTEKLETYIRSQETDAKLLQSLRDLTEGQAPGQTQAKDSRQIVRELAVQAEQPEDMVILETHIDKLDGWNDSAKQSPHRSPGPLLARKSTRSPGSSSPDRRRHNAMTSSYPYPGSATLPPNLVSHAVAMGFLNQKHSSSTSKNTIPSPAFPSNPLTPIGQKGLTTSHKHATPLKSRTPNIRCGTQPSRPSLSDTSGIESGTSSGASMVSASLHPADKSLPPAWSLNDNQPPLNVTSFGPTDNKFKRLQTSSKPSTSYKQTPSTSADKSRPSKSGLADASLSLNRHHRGRRSEGGAGYSGGSGISSTSSSDYLHVCYYLPNEPVPYVTKFAGRFITLKQFKQIVHGKRGNFKYYFMCQSDEFGGELVQKEVYDECEMLPLHGGKVHARIVSFD